MSDGNGDNDADKRPRIFGRAETRDAMVEVNVTGAEGETTDDLEETFENAVDRMSEEVDIEPDPDGREFR